MAIIETEIDNNIAIITLNNGQNQQDLDFAKAMLATLDEIEADKKVRAIVIAGSDEKHWSTGINLNWLMAAMNEKRHDDIKEFMYSMNEVFGRLLTIPLPVIASITGHAFGNGGMLACACDFRFMRMDRGYFCFPEVDINIPFLPGMIEFVKTAVPYYRFNEMKLTGRRVTAEELAKDHVLEAACPDAGATLAAAKEFAATFNKNRRIFGEHKRRLHKHILKTFEEEDKPIIDALQLMV